MKVVMKWVTICFLSILCNHSFSQNVGIGTNNPNANAKLDISDSAKGILIPRMDSTHRKNIPNTNGLMVYDTTTKCFWFNNGISWVNIPQAGNTKGDMLYWNSNRWVLLPAGLPSQYLSLAVGTLIPVWTGASSTFLTTTSVSSITQTTAASGGNISTDGGTTITARGVVWSTAVNPTIALITKTIDGTGTGNFVSNLTGLAANTTYYVRSYATNANGTTYGNEVNFTTATASFTLGQTYGGGIVFYVDGTGQHGLIAAPVDQSGNITWSNGAATPLTNATGLAIGTGGTNTTTIINVQGAGSYAASLCRLYYSGGGFNDWRLPSLYELNELFLQRNLSGINMTSTYYWSSSETSNFNAWTVNFFDSSPNQQDFGKQSTVAVRAVRAF
jgi:Protein of unknown function (DUF1566)